MGGMIVSAERLALAPPDRLDAVVHVPGSKSITNRALLVAALARGESLLQGALEAEDVSIELLGLLEVLGGNGDEVHACDVHGTGSYRLNPALNSVTCRSFRAATGRPSVLESAINHVV
jgi:5-enolpyruvylshikimate-3-phosphate synthase